MSITLKTDDNNNNNYYQLTQSNQEHLRKTSTLILGLIMVTFIANALLPILLPLGLLITLSTIAVICTLMIFGVLSAEKANFDIKGKDDRFFRRL